jgi:thiol-disulfide isomerase/thioredoxin
MATGTARVCAPELRGAGGWINSERPLTLADLRGRVVLLDFWTFCCINCLRVIEELRPLERRFGDALVVIGVHSPKFPHEGTHAAVEQAVRRHRVEHPVLDDPDLETWQRYGVRAWPTLVLIDQQGDVVASASGEGNADALGKLIERLVGGGEAPDVPAFPQVRPPAPDELAFPGKVCAGPHGSIAIADTGNDRVLLVGRDGGVQAAFDGFHQPQGVRFDGHRLLVCDTAAGRLVAVDITSGQRTVLASGLHSPWDVAVLPDAVLALAEAGRHRILAVPGDGGEPSVLAGTGAEGLRDGPAQLAHLAQPSGLALRQDGALLIADSEVSALRVLRDGSVETLVGRGLFEWGSADGDRATARLQHPLGVAVLPDSTVAVADTFNSLLRVWRDGRLNTLALEERLDEPGGLDVLPNGWLVVADTNRHRVVGVDPGSGTVQTLFPSRREHERLAGASGAQVRVALDVDLGSEPLDMAQGAPVRIRRGPTRPGREIGRPRCRGAARGRRRGNVRRKHLHRAPLSPLLRR